MPSEQNVHAILPGKRRALSDTSALLSRPRGALVLCVLMYVAAALHPVLLAAVGWPSMEILWFAMLIPTIVLSFYHGRRGVLSSTLIAVVLFVSVEYVAHRSTALTGERSLFAASVFLAIVILGIAIGELAELLRREYLGRVRAERVAATNELAVALRHEIYNPLAALLAEVEMLQEDADELGAEQRDSVASVAELARRIRTLVDRVATLEDPERVEYREGEWMTDLSTGR